MGELVTTTVETDTADTPPVDSGDTTVVIADGGDDTASLVSIAATVGRIEARMDALETRQGETEVVAAMAETTAEVAAETAVAAIDEAASAGDAAIEAAAAAGEAATETDMPPEREHWFFKKAPWKRQQG